jgi:hypothetical protein
MKVHQFIFFISFLCFFLFSDRSGSPDKHRSRECFLCHRPVSTGLGWASSGRGGMQQQAAAAQAPRYALAAPTCPSRPAPLPPLRSNAAGPSCRGAPSAVLTSRPSPTSAVALSAFLATATGHALAPRRAPRVNCPRGRNLTIHNNVYTTVLK